MALTSGTKLGPYDIQSLLGSGGMGEVYRARDSRLDRIVAIKVLPTSCSADAERLQRFVQEARSAAALNHPNILSIFDIGEDRGAPYIVSELLEGQTLRERIRSGPLSSRKAIDYALQVARGLAAAHDKGIVHRDLKPENLFLTHDDRVKILDFGLAKLTRPETDTDADAATMQANTEPGRVMGTAGYMSPEQVRGKPLDARTDLFSFGIVLYEMATGAVPFRGETSGVIFDAIMNRAPVAPVRLNPELPAKLEDVINRALEKDRDLRYQHAVDIKSELLRLKRDLESGRSSAVGSSPSMPVAGGNTQTESQPPAAAGPGTKTSGRSVAVSSGSSASVPGGVEAVPLTPPSQAKWKLVVSTAVVLILAAVAGGLYWRKHQAPKLTDKDQLILADFTNQTGDPVFDSTLKEALAIQLEQSPLLQLVSDAELHNNLQYLSQPREQRITPELAQQLGQRLGVKAYLAGTIANLGPAYVIQINAVNCGTGDVFAREQVTANDKAGVLQAVSNAATAMRARLGESMASIQKLTTPFTNVTTASLQAFHAFSLGEDEHRVGRDFPQAASFYQEAIRLDPSFAMAYARLGVAYGNQGAVAKAVENVKKAYELRERVTERERMYIEAQYALQQYDLPKALESYKLFVATYPRDAAAWNNLASSYQTIGDYEQASVGFEKAWEIARWNDVAANNAAGTLMGIDRMQEGEHYLKEALEQGGADSTSYQANAMVDDLISGRPDWEKHVQWAAGRPDGFIVQAGAAAVYLYLGKMHEADRQWEQAGQKAEQQHLSDAAGGLYAVKALHDALVSNCSAARESAHHGLTLDRSVATVPNAALALALCGEESAALKETERVAAEAPTNTLVNDIYLPEVKAAAALAAHHPEQVAALLTSAVPYVLVTKIPHLLGRASLEMKHGQQAVTDFEPGVRYRGLALQEGSTGNPQAPDYVLCLLGTARAEALFDRAAATRSYQQLLDIWKNADPDFIPAQEARRELSALTATSKN